MAHTRAGDLRSLLESSLKGKEILNSYILHKNITDHQQDVIVQIIIDNEIRDDIDYRITNSKFDILANAVVALFPTEVKEVYFSQSLRKIQGVWRKVGGGKLFRRFYNCRRSLHLHGLLKNKKQNDCSEPGPSKIVEVSLCKAVVDVDDEDMKWLMNSIEPWNDVVMRWEKTYEHRLKDSDKTTISQYTKKFPALKMKLGYTLLESDFQKLYPGKDMQLFSLNFDLFSAKIIDYAKTLNRSNIVEYLCQFSEDLPKDMYTIQVLMLLPLLIKPTIVKKRKGSGSWKPSCLEVSEGFIIHAKAAGDIKRILSERVNKLAEFGLTLQPTPLIVGQDLKNITASYVVLDNHLYQLPTPLKAVDVCFKVIHTLNACYPVEAEQVWLLIQRGIYQIKTDYDKCLTATENILKSISF